MTKRNNYWKKRFEALEQENYEAGKSYYEELQQDFQRASAEMEHEIFYWYERLADNNGVSYLEAQKLLKKNELEEFHWSVETYIKRGKENKVDQRWLTELENASAKVHISRLEAMKIQTKQYAELLFANYSRGTKEYLSNIYLNSYYKSAYEVARGTGIGHTFHAIDTRKMNIILSKPWARDGKNFSERIWGNRDKLVSNLHAELTQNIIRGQDPQKAINSLAKKMNVSKSEAGNLIMTETAAVSSAAQKACFDELDVEQFQVLETLDSLTCSLCGAMDGKVYPMKDHVVGVTASPFHPRCRGTSIPYFEDNKGNRAARDKDGKTVNVSGNITYEEWFKKYVEGDPEYYLQYQKDQNSTQDRKQYEKYKGVIKTPDIKSFADFQDMKYTNSEYYDFLKLDYKRRNALINHPEKALPFASKAVAPDPKFTHYLFGGENPKGLAKGAAIESRLGYNIENWKEFQKEICRQSMNYPSKFRENNGYGDIYEQKMVLYGLKGKPANVVVGWIVKENDVLSMTSAYIKEV